MLRRLGEWGFPIHTACAYYFWNETTGAIADYSGTYPITITLAEVDEDVEVEDKLVLQSQINTMQTKINELENIIASLTARLDVLESR